MRNLGGSWDSCGRGQLYELGKLSAGKVAQLAGMERLTFLEHLADVDVPAINLRDDEIEAEIEAAQDL